MRARVRFLLGLAGCLFGGASAVAAVHRADCGDPKWNSIEALNAVVLGLGDQLLLRAGCRWNGILRLHGSGAEGHPAVVDRYGEGPAPVIDGGGGEAAVVLHNQEFIEVRNLEIVNDAKEPGIRRGLVVRIENLGRAARQIRLTGLNVHNVKGRLGSDMESKSTGGIGVEIVTRKKPARLDGLIIENNRVRSVDGVGIYLNTDTVPHPRDPAWEALRHTGVVVRGNMLEDIGKNAIIVRAALAPVISHNVVRKAAARYHGNAIFVFGCKDARMEFNDVSETSFHKIEGAAFDSDYNSEGTVIQYNYSHRNGGGLVNICNNPASKPPRGYNDGTIIRYNVSRDETDRVIAFDGPATNTHVYNNTIIVGSGRKPRIVEFDVFGDTDGYADGAWFQNNIIVNEGEGFYAPGKAANVIFEANCYFGRRLGDVPTDSKAIYAAPEFVSADSVNESVESLAGLRLRESSPCAGSGVTVPGNGGRDFLGNPVPERNPDRGAFQQQK